MTAISIAIAAMRTASVRHDPPQARPQEADRRTALPRGRSPPANPHGALLPRIQRLRRSALLSADDRDGGAATEYRLVSSGALVVLDPAIPAATSSRTPPGPAEQRLRHVQGERQYRMSMNPVAPGRGPTPVDIRV